MIFLNAFLVGGLICALAEVFQDFFKLTPGQVTCYFVVLGALLDFFHIYDKIIDFAEAGALVPITSFGHLLTHGASALLESAGLLSIFTNVLANVSAGIGSAIFIAIVCGLIFKPKD